MTTLAEKLTWFYSSIDEDLALWDGATKGPWISNAEYVRTAMLGLEGRVIADCDVSSMLLEQATKNAKAIARSRTICPAVLRALKSQVEWLEERMNYEYDWHQHEAYSRGKASLSMDYKNQLHTLIDSYRKEVCVE